MCLFTQKTKSDSPARITFHLFFKQLYKISEKLCLNPQFQQGNRLPITGIQNEGS